MVKVGMSCASAAGGTAEMILEGVTVEVEVDTFVSIHA